jgi:hypothetical protein
VNDGLGAVFGIVSGVVNATNNQQHISLSPVWRECSLLLFQWAQAPREQASGMTEIAREKRRSKIEEEIEEMSLFCSCEVAPEDAQHGGRLAEQPDQLVQAMAQASLAYHNTIFPTMVSAFGRALGHVAFKPIIRSFSPGFRDRGGFYHQHILAHFAVGAVKSLITIVPGGRREMTIVGII